MNDHQDTTRSLTQRDATEREIPAFAVLGSRRLNPLYPRPAFDVLIAHQLEEALEAMEALLLELDHLHPHDLLRLRDAVNDAVDRWVPVERQGRNGTRLAIPPGSAEGRGEAATCV